MSADESQDDAKGTQVGLSQRSKRELNFANATFTKNEPPASARCSITSLMNSSARYQDILLAAKQFIPIRGYAQPKLARLSRCSQKVDTHRRHLLHANGRVRLSLWTCGIFFVELTGVFCRVAGIPSQSAHQGFVPPAQGAEQAGFVQAVGARSTPPAQRGVRVFRVISIVASLMV